MDVVSPSGTDSYERYRGRMMALGQAHFRLDRDVAEALTHDVFATYLAHESEVRNPEQWLLGGMRRACCRYLDRLRPTRSLPDTEDAGPHSDGARLTAFLSTDPRSAIEAKLTLQEIVRRLGDRCRNVIRLYRLEGRTAAELAEELDTTVRYAEKMAHDCMKRAKEIFLALDRTKK